MARTTSRTPSLSKTSASSARRTSPVSKHADSTASRLGREADAIPSYERAIELSPGEAEAYYAIGIAYYNRREYDRAVEWLERYLRVDPDAPNRSRVRDMIEVLER